jgi:hypothetical protein
MRTCVLKKCFGILQGGLDDDSFENYKSGLMGKLLEKDPSLTYESNRLWNQIVDKRYFTLLFKLSVILVIKYHNHQLLFLTWPELVEVMTS